MSSEKEKKATFTIFLIVKAAAFFISFSCIFVLRHMWQTHHTRGPARHYNTGKIPMLWAKRKTNGMVMQESRCETNAIPDATVVSMP